MRRHVKQDPSRPSISVVNPSSPLILIKCVQSRTNQFGNSNGNPPSLIYLYDFPLRSSSPYLPPPTLVHPLQWEQWQHAYWIVNTQFVDSYSSCDVFPVGSPIKYFNYSEYSEVGQSLPLFWDRRRRRCLWCMWHFTVGIGWRSFGDIIVVVLDWILLFWLTGHIDLVTRLLLFDTHGSRTRGRSCLSPPGRLGCL